MYGFDAMTRRTRRSSTARTDAWVLDLVGNRERTRADGVDTAYSAVDGRDRYASVAGDSLTFDRAGNLLSDGKFSYVYDGFRRLVRIVQLVPGTSGTTVARYDYDPAGRRVVEARPGAPAVVIAYDGVDRIADYRDGACVGQYVHGPAVDDPVELAAAGATHTYHLDLQGSVRVLSRADGTAAALYAYDPFGVLRPSSGPLLEPPGAPSATVATQPFGYAARPFEAATASYDARARCYVPHLGRFLQRDPAGVVDGHLYAYAGNHPLAFGDPSGLARGERAPAAPPSIVNPGKWLLTLRDSYLRDKYKAAIAAKSVSAGRAIELAKEADDLFGAEAAARDASAYRNATRAATQEALSPAARAFSKALDKPRLWPDLFRYYAKEGDEFGTLARVAEASGRSRGWLLWGARAAKAGGIIGVTVGVAMSTYRIAKSPTPCVVAEEIAGTGGGLTGAIGGGAGGAAIGASAFGGPVAIAVTAAVFSIAGAYVGDRGARYVIRKIGDCNE